MTQYVALQPITAGDVLAYNPGDPVHESNVDRNGYVIGEQVAPVGSDQAVGVLRGLGILPPADDESDVDSDDAGSGPALEFDPAQHSIGAVNAHLDEHPDDAHRVLAAEDRGKRRAGILHGPHGSPPDVAEV